MRKIMKLKNGMKKNYKIKLKSTLTRVFLKCTITSDILVRCGIKNN
jgi:hypothetical protein